MRKIYDKIIAPFTGNQLGTLDVILKSIATEGLTVEQYQKERSMSVERQKAQAKLDHEKFMKEREEQLEKIKPQIGKEVSKYKLCPECGKGYLLPLKRGDTRDILECRKCRYSIFIGE